MIENIQPRRLVIGSITTSYTNAFINHSSVIDEDAAGKVFWTTISGYTESGHIVVPGVQLNFSKLTGLEPSSLYGISGAFFDAMADSELLEAKSGVSISDEFIVSTKTAPSITSIEQTSTQVDIGITDPRLTFTIGGDATSYILEYSLDLGTSWTPVSSTSNKISIPLPANDYTFRVSGVIVLPTSTEISDPIEYSEGVFTVEGGSSVPAAPTSLSASIGRIQTSFERFDVRLSWLWDRGTTGNIKEFIVKGYPTASVYSFTNPLVMTSAGTSLETVLIDIQKNLQMVFRVDALGYDDTLVSSETLTLTVTDDTVDTDYEEASGVEVTYAGIKAFTIDDNNVQTESFSLDAATGSVAIGYIDPQLGAPIRFDPVTGYVTVQGAVIANEIVSASFVMSQLTSSDRPSIRTTNKFNYADYNSGLYMGYNTDTGNPSFQFDMGSETEHIRWDGSNLYISGDVSIGTPGNATPLTQIGVDSTRYYNQEVVNFDGTFDEASAELYVLNLLVGSIIPVGSVVTQYDSVDYSKSKSAMWEDGGWTVPTVFINGSLMATQSITGDSINSNTILTGHIDARSLTFIDSATDSLPTEIDNSNAISTAAQDATEKAEAAQQAAEEYSLAKANLAEVSSKAYADGIVTEEEQRAIQDATGKADAAAANAISTAASDATGKANSAQNAAEGYALAKANVAEVTAKAYADGIVTDEENRAIQGATDKADAAAANAISTAASDATDKALLLRNQLEIVNAYNKWHVSRYNGVSSPGLPTIDLLDGLTPDETFVVDDDLSLVRDIGDNYLATLSTKVYVTSDREVSYTFSHDDGCTVYVNGISVYSESRNLHDQSINYTLSKGWNRVVYLYNEGTGGDGIFAISTSLSQLVDRLGILDLSIPLATEAYSLAKANLAETTAKAHADGIVTEEEQRAIQDATDKANAASNLAISTAAQDATEKAEAAEASASYGYGTYSGNYPISSDGEGYLFKFKPVDFANIEDMVVVVDQIDLEANVFLTVNGTEITPIGGTSDTREWNKFEIDSSYLNSSSDNFVHVGHKAGSSADFGVLFSISLLKNTETIKGSIDKANQAKQDAKDYSDDTFVTSVFYGQDIASIQDQIDGSITNWFYPGEPSVSNIPSSGWPTDSEKDTHLGDIYYDEDTGYAYRFQLLTSVYSWKRIADEGIAAALAVASTAQDTADQKRRVFVITPVIPYDVGDLWDVPGLGIRRCSTPKTLTGSYSISDWDLIVDNAGKAVAEGNRAVEQASTDATTKANQAISRSANNLINTAGWYTGRGLPFGELEEFNPGNSSNWIDYQVGPFGNRIPVLTQYTTDNQDPSGGWSGGIQFEINGINYNNKAAYRVSCWILRNTNEPSFYMGYGSSDVWDLGTINNNTNPYSFPNKLPPSANKWYLLVAVVHGSNYEDATDSGQTGWYDPVTGLMVGSEGNEYRARSDSSSLFFRISQYRTKIGCVTEFYQPLVQKLDGSETPIGSLLVDPSLILNTANQAVTERIYPQSKLQISGGNYQNDTNSGWGIHKEGHAVFNDVRVRGHVEMLSGHISSRLSLGATSGANWSFIDGSSSVYAAYFGNGTSWIKKNGDCKFGSGTFEGTVLADRIDADVVAAAPKNISARSGYGTYLLMSGTVGASKSAVSRKLFIPAFQIELYASATHYDSNGSTSASVSVRIQCSYNYRNWYTSGFHEISVYDRGGNTDRKSLVGVIGACVLTFNNGSSGSYFVRAILRRSGVYADVKLSEQKTVVSLFRAGSSLS